MNPPSIDTPPSMNPPSIDTPPSMNPPSIETPPSMNPPSPVNPPPNHTATLISLASLACHALLSAVLARLLLYVYSPLADAAPGLSVGSTTTPRAILATLAALVFYVDAVSALHSRMLRPPPWLKLDACEHPVPAGLLLATTAFLVLCSFYVGWT